MREYLELKAKVADNELYVAKLMKEKEQWSQIKETSSVGVQFNYLIPSMGKSIKAGLQYYTSPDVMLLLWFNSSMKHASKGQIAHTFD